MRCWSCVLHVSQLAISNDVVQNLDDVARNLDDVVRNLGDVVRNLDDVVRNLDDAVRLYCTNTVRLQLEMRCILPIYCIFHIKTARFKAPEGSCTELDNHACAGGAPPRWRWGSHTHAQRQGRNIGPRRPRGDRGRSTPENFGP